MHSPGRRILSFAVFGAAAVMAALVLRGGKGFAQDFPVILQITSPADGTVVNPGQTVTVVVTPTSGDTFSGVFVLSNGLFQSDLSLTGPPFQCPVTIPKNISAGKYQLTAIGARAGQQPGKSPSISLDVEPSLPISKIRVQPEIINFRYARDRMPLDVIGTFSDGSAMEITKSSRTTYSTGDPNTATVSSGGIVTAVGSGGLGITPIVVRYGGQQFAVQVSTKRLQLAPLTVTPDNASRLYGDPNLTFTGTITGLRNGDNITATYSTTATPASAVGTYDITATLNNPGGKLGNYTVTLKKGTLTVNPAPLTVTADSFSRLYASPNPTFTGTIVGIKNTDNITATYSTSPATDATTAVGSYPIVPTLVDPTNKLGNYTVTRINGTLTINPAPLTITADDKTKVLNASNPSLTAIYSGFVLGQNQSVLAGTLTCTTTATSSPVGSYLITCSGQSSTNYAITYVPGTLSVIYAPAGTSCLGDLEHTILQPINADGTSVWQQGRTIPAKFRVCDANGISIGTPGVVNSFQLTGIISGTVANVNQTVASTTPDTAFRWDPTGQQWIFNISTSGLLANQTYMYAITLNDGTTINFQYGLR